MVGSRLLSAPFNSFHNVTFLSFPLCMWGMATCVSYFRIAFYLPPTHSQEFSRASFFQGGILGIGDKYRRKNGEKTATAIDFVFLNKSENCVCRATCCSIFLFSFLRVKDKMKMLDEKRGGERIFREMVRSVYKSLKLNPQGNRIRSIRISREQASLYDYDKLYSSDY